ncbi:MAG: AAA family ATPase [Bryobacteraceae bacterium]
MSETSNTRAPASVTHVELDNFTAFRHLVLSTSPGVNILVGANGTGKTHILKAIYASASPDEPGAKLVRVFLPFGGRHERLAHQSQTAGDIVTRVTFGDTEVALRFGEPTHQLRTGSIHVTGENGTLPKAVFIPAKEMLSNAPGFRSLYASREITFDETFADLIDRAFLPKLKVIPAMVQEQVTRLERLIGGQVVTRGEHFFLRNEHGELEFNLLAEGLRKLALVCLFLANGSVSAGTILLWDEPEANLNPVLIKALVSVLLSLRRLGVQIFLATHDYALLKEFDLQAEPSDGVRYHALYRDQGDGVVRVNSVDDYSAIHPSSINQAFDDILERDLDKRMRPVTKT